MTFDVVTIALIAGILLVAGVSKGVIGFGLPSVSMGLLTLLMTPLQAAALLLAPNIVTNIWQGLVGGHLRVLLRRLAPLLIGSLAGIALAEWWIGGRDLRWAARLLGLTLLLYAALGLFAIKFSIPKAQEAAWGWVMGILTGLMTLATGVFVIPSGPYLNAIGLEKDELVQALGLVFLIASIGLALALWSRGAIAPAVAGTSALALLPAIAGMLIGQKLRERISQVLFKRLFYLGLLALGALLIIKG